MDNPTEKTKIGKELTEEQGKQLSDGMALREMTQTKGWQILEGWLKSRAFHSWVDPRETKSKKDWEWQELNAFHSADVAKELLEDVNEAMGISDELDDIRTGKETMGTGLKI